MSAPAIPPARPLAPQRVQAAREAQRAFFNTALAGEAQPSPAATSGAPVQAVARTGPLPAAPDPRLRPGSIVDIKV